MAVRRVGLLLRRDRRPIPAGTHRSDRETGDDRHFIRRRGPNAFRDYALGLIAKWTPIIEAHRNGTLNLHGLNDQDRARWQTGTIPSTVAQLAAILKWPPVEPAEMRCPTLWLVGSANEQAMPGVTEYRQRLRGTQVILRVLPGLTHADELTSVDDVLPPLLAFIR
jgi:hypothetical protein